MKDVIFYLLLLAAFSGTALCTLPPTPGLRLRYACPPRCYAGQPHGSTCGPNCTCRAHTENPLSLFSRYYGSMWTSTSCGPSYQLWLLAILSTGSETRRLVWPELYLPSSHSVPGVHDVRGNPLSDTLSDASMEPAKTTTISTPMMLPESGPGFLYRRCIVL
ncbi:hypothetical protein MTO96_018508 [Rhipicephalus appendiculatus]